MSNVQTPNLPKPFVFVLMPFMPELNDIYQFGIKRAGEAVGAYCERVDEQIFTESIMERIVNQITKADIIVADMTGRNPNVLYEVGYANALGKPIILLSQHADDIPFDLKHYPHIIYGGSSGRLESELERRLKWFIENPVRKAPTKRTGHPQTDEKEAIRPREHALIFQLRELLSRFDNPAPLFDVFLSYSRADEAPAKQLYEKLKGSEVRAYFAPKELIGGDPFTEEIRQALINSFEIWVLTTPSSLKSEWVTTEWAAAWVLKKRIVPILLRCNVDALPERLKSFQLIDYHEVDSLVTQLKARLASENTNS